MGTLTDILKWQSLAHHKRNKNHDEIFFWLFEFAVLFICNFFGFSYLFYRIFAEKEEWGHEKKVKVCLLTCKSCAVGCAEIGKNGLNFSFSVEHFFIYNIL